MRSKLSINFFLIPAAVFSLLISSSAAQEASKKRPKIKDFGSSLERLKWDPLKNAAIKRTHPDQSTTNSDEDDVVRIDTNLVMSDILVVDQKGNIVTGLTADDFVITEDGEAQQVGHFRLGDNISIPRTIVLIFDYSGSQFPYLRNSVNAAKLMVDKLAPRDRMAIVTDDVELLVDFTDDKKKLKEKLESLANRVKDSSFLGLIGKARRFGKSAQYSALLATLNEAFLEEDLRPIIVFQTDGDEIFNMRDPVIKASLPPDLPDDFRQELGRIEKQRQLEFPPEILEFSLADVYRAVERSRATIYTVVPGYQLVGLTEEKRAEKTKERIERLRAEFLAKVDPKRRKLFEDSDRRWRRFSPVNLAFQANQMFVTQTALAAVAPRTGGWTEFLEKPEQAEGIYNRIFADINQRYLVGYYPTNKELDGKRRRIKFEVKGRPEYTILGRNYYYAPSDR